MSAMLAAGAVVVGGAAACCWYSKLVRPIAEYSTGAKRRALYPVEKGIGPGAQEALLAKDVTIQRKFFTRPSGELIFYQHIEPVGRAPTHIVLYFHGYMSNSDFHVENCLKFARRGAAVVVMDLPGHGRSDGLLYYTPDWWELCNSLWELLDAVVEPMRSRLPNPRQVFATGASLGGGLAACLAIQRPVYFAGIMLIAPMLVISDDVKPPVFVQNLLKKLVGPFRLSWPVTPSKSTTGNDFTDPEQGRRWDAGNPFSIKGLKPRLATAVECAFTFPEWMEEHMSELRTPFIVLHSKMDKTTDPKMSERLHKEASGEDKTLRLFDDAFHCELFCCTPGHSRLISMPWTPEQVKRTDACFNEIFEWMAKRI